MVGRAVEPAWRAPKPAGRASEEAAALGGPRIKLGEPCSQVRGPWIQLGVSRLAGTALIPAERTLELAERALESAGRPFEASWEARSHLRGPGKGGRRKQTDRLNGAFMICGGTIVHRPLQGRYPKAWKND